ncbi:hypothetical protein GE061_011043 [Apolygus lucorum]|uniref:CCHC-type domain-containing protein n=1 Tax=Apolygus lucorum TaxID=248454 RepID=A0A8S9XXJ0_APOLU|nr:hypothetical protein GE061_011043 [Apolygus lucorum]
MSSSQSQPVNIRQFTGIDFEIWIYRVERLLDRNGVLEVCKWDKPTDENDKAAIVKFIQDDAKAKDLISQCVHDDLIGLIRNEPTSKSILAVLESTYVKKGMTSGVQLQRKLRNMAYNGQIPMNEYLLEYEKTVKDLVATGEAVSDTSYITTLLASLPEEYDSVVSALDVLLSTKPTECSKELVRNRLLAEESRIKGRQTSENDNRNSGTAFSTFRRPANFRSNPPVERHIGNSGRNEQFQNRRGTNYNYRGGGRGKFRGKCLNCNIRGHKKRDCPSLKNVNHGSNSRSDFHGAKLLQEEDDNEISFFMDDVNNNTAVFANSSGEHFDGSIRCVLDSGANPPLLIDVESHVSSPVKEPNQSNPTHYSQDKSGQSSQDESAQSSQDKSAQSSQDRSAQSSQDRSAQSSQDKSAQSSQLRSAQSSQDKSAQSSLVRRGRKRRAQPETDVHTPSKQLRVSSELEPADVDLPDESDDEFENPTRRSQRARKIPARFEDYEMMMALSMGVALSSEGVPRSYAEAEKSECWREAVNV